MAAMTGRAAAFGMIAGRRLWAVPVQAGKGCNPRASPNRHLSSMPKNGYGPANMQCAARATARRDQLVDGKLEHQLMTAFGKIHRSVPSAAQGPQWAVSNRLDFLHSQNAAGRHSVKRARTRPSPRRARTSALERNEAERVERPAHPRWFSLTTGVGAPRLRLME